MDQTSKMALDHNVRPEHNIIVTGHKSGGKSWLISRMIDGDIPPRYSPSPILGRDAYIYQIGCRQILFNIYETSGCCCTPSLDSTEILEQADGIIIVHEILSKESFDCAKKTVKKIRRSFKNAKSTQFLVCSKFDILPQECPLPEGVELKNEKSLARKYDLSLFRTSAVSNFNVKEMFEAMFDNVWYSDIDKRIFNVLILGDENVGKTSLLQRFSKNNFVEDHDKNEEVTHCILPMILNRRSSLSKMRLLNAREGSDTDRFRHAMIHYYADVHGIILVYDVTNRASFDNIPKWLEIIRQRKNTDNVTKIIIVGNKLDLFQDMNVCYEEAKELANKEDIDLFQVSAKGNLMVFNLFTNLMKSMSMEAETKEIKRQYSCLDCLGNPCRVAEAYSKEAKMSDASYILIPEEFSGMDSRNSDIEQWKYKSHYAGSGSNSDESRFKYRSYSAPSGSNSDESSLSRSDVESYHTANSDTKTSQASSRSDVESYHTANSEIKKSQSSFYLDSEIDSLLDYK